MLKVMLKEILEKIEVKSNGLELKSDSNLVKGWSKEFNVPVEFVMITWKQAICYFLKNGKERCKPKESEYPIVVDIFKAIMKKWISKLNDDIKYKLKNPTIKGNKTKIHYEEAKEISLKEKMKEYRKNLKECCKKCPSICEW